MFRRPREPGEAEPVRERTRSALTVREEMIEVRRDPHLVKAKLEMEIKFRKMLLVPMAAIGGLVTVPPIVVAPRDYASYVLAAGISGYLAARLKNVRRQRRLVGRLDEIITKHLPESEAVKIEYENNVSALRFQARALAGAGTFGIVVGLSSVGLGVWTDRPSSYILGSAFTIVSAGINSSGRYRQKKLETVATLMILTTSSGYALDDSRNAALIRDLKGGETANLHMHFSRDTATVHITTTQIRSITDANSGIKDLPHWDGQDRRI